MDAKIKEIQHNSLGQKKRLLILESTDGIRELITRNFSLRKFAVQLQEWANTHSIQRTIISHRRILHSTLRKASKKYDVIWLRGHGNSNKIYLGDYLFSKDDPKMMQELAAKTKKGTIILFDSCCVGSGDDNFAKDFSAACPHAVVYATKSVHQMYWGLDFQNGIPHFRDFIGRDSTRIYKAGVLQEKRSLKSH